MKLRSVRAPISSLKALPIMSIGTTIEIGRSRQLPQRSECWSPNSAGRQRPTLKRRRPIRPFLGVSQDSRYTIKSRREQTGRIYATGSPLRRKIVLLTPRMIARGKTMSAIERARTRAVAAGTQNRDPPIKMPSQTADGAFCMFESVTIFPRSCFCPHPLAESRPQPTSCTCRR